MKTPSIMRKVIIFGFAHCGTTILRTIISHIPGVLDTVDEYPTLEEAMLKDENLQQKAALKDGSEFVLLKWPYLLSKEVLLEKYADYTKIFIIRNPLYVYTSLNRRMQSMDWNNTPKCFLWDHLAQKFLSTAIDFCHYQLHPEEVPNLL